MDEFHTHVQTTDIPSSKKQQQLEKGNYLGQWHHLDLTSQLAKTVLRYHTNVNIILHFLCENVKSTWNSKGFTSNVVTAFDNSILMRNIYSISSQWLRRNIYFFIKELLCSSSIIQTFNNLSPTSINFYIDAVVALPFHYLQIVGLVHHSFFKEWILAPETWFVVNKQ